MYGTAQMQLHTRKCQTHELNIAVNFNDLRVILCILACSILSIRVVYSQVVHVSALHTPVTTYAIFI